MTHRLKAKVKKILPQDVSLDLSEWDSVLKKSSNPSVYHLQSSVAYYIEYFNGENSSFVLYENKKAIGVFPLLAYQNNEKWILSANGSYILEPLFIDGVSKKRKKRLEKSLKVFINKLSKFLGVTENKFSISFKGMTSWYYLWLENAQEESINHHLSVDLRKNLSEIRLQFRKSYKPLVNKALKEWDISICTSDLNKDFEAFRMLHLEVSGKETRSRESWDIQLQNIINGKAFLVTAKDNDLLIGGGLFSYTKFMGIYGVGAYKRELFDKPIGHDVQMKAIEFLKEKGCQWYEIGRRHYLVDRVKPTKKELSISHFKEGFAMHTFVKPHCTVNVE